LYDGAVRDPARPPRIVRRRSAVHGYGVFAAETISKNARVIDYAGELLLLDHRRADDSVPLPAWLSEQDLRTLCERRTAIQALHVSRLSGPDGPDARGMGA
jgi:hypothetical protein